MLLPHRVKILSRVCVFVLKNSIFLWVRNPGLIKTCLCRELLQKTEVYLCEWLTEGETQVSGFSSENIKQTQNWSLERCSVHAQAPSLKSTHTHTHTHTHLDLDPLLHSWFGSVWVCVHTLGCQVSLQYYQCQQVWRRDKDACACFVHWHVCVCVWFMRTLPTLWVKMSLQRL